MSTEAKAFKWIGPGVLHIHKFAGNNHVDTLVIHPEGEPTPDGKGFYSGIVRKAENLEHLTAVRLAELVKDGKAVMINFLEGAEASIAKVKDSVGEGETDKAVSDIAKDNAQIKANADTAHAAELAKQGAVKIEAAPAGAGPK